jgi:DNA polymerase-3 subunit alpha
MPEEVTAASAESSCRPFVHLNLHTHYSILEGATKIPDLVKIAKANNMPAVAVTDSGVMYGAIELYTQAEYAGIKAIIGSELYVVEGDITDRSMKKTMHNLVLLAKNRTGYSNLVKLVSKGQLEGFYYKPRINWELLAEYSEGLICLTADLYGPIAHAILRGNPQEARDRAKRLHEIFGEDLYLEIQDHNNDAERQVSYEITRISEELGIPVVATNDCHFSRPGDVQMHEILQCMQMGKTLNDASRNYKYGPDYYIKNGDEMARLFGHLDREIVEQALNNTLVIADKCNLELELGKSILPDYPLEPGETSEGKLLELCLKNAEWRYGSVTPEVRERLDFELGIINQMGFPNYFLIVWDFINYARMNNIPVGPGRGSAAGSLVAYVLGITNIDPLEHNLLFERFLNPERVTMPDVDIDFCIERRGEVIQYVTEKYGKERVCQIITFGTLAARAAVKAVARVMEIPFAESDKLAKMIPATPGTKLKDALQEGMELAKACEADPKVKHIVDLAQAIEGLVCNVGVHAAGVVIAKDPITETMPLQNSKEGSVVSQYQMADLEKVGLLKMDFLGLRNLTIIDNALKLIDKNHGVKLDMDHVPLDDEKVYELLSAGDTDGVFQLESSGMKALVRDLRPSVFEDINALVALYRPGPLNSGMVKTFVDRKHGRQQVTYDHPDLEPILSATYGTIVYQEQIMQISQVLAGYSLGRADLLRRAMGKKKAEVMAKERDGFVGGAVAHGVDDGLANTLFDTMTEFAAYCFNRSHSAAYAFVAFQTAYLKAHYPVEYLSALLSSVASDLEKIQHYIVTARRMGIQTLPPDLQKSGADFTPDNGSIRFGLASIKGVGLGVVEAIIAKRDEKPFETLEDFFSRVDPKVLNRKTLEALALAGAFDSFGVTRRQLYHNLDTCISFANKAQEDALTGQVSLFAALGGGGGGDSGGGSFGGLILSGDANEEFTNEEIQQYEKQLLGFYVSSHPLDDLIDTLPLVVTHQVSELKECRDGEEVLVGGLVSNAKRRISKSNRPLCIGTIEDLTASVEFVAFSEALEKYGELMADGRKVIIKGKVSFRGDDNETYSVMVNEMRDFQSVQPLYLTFDRPPKYADAVSLAEFLAKNRGCTPVILNFRDGTRIKTAPKFWVDPDKRTAISQALLHSFADVVRVS